MAAGMRVGTKGTAKSASKGTTRRYVRDAGRAPRGAAQTATASIGFVMLALAVGFVIGFAVYLVMNLSTWLTSLLWDGLGGLVGVSWFSLVVCTLGGLVIGIWTWWSHDTVRPLEEVLKQFKETGSYRTNGVAKPVVTFLLPLVFGGSIGFEAGLTGLITAGSCWIRDKIKAAGLRYVAVAEVSMSASLAAIFRTPLVGIVAGAENAPGDDEGMLREPSVDDYDMRRGAKVVLYTSAAFGAFAGIRAFSALFSVTGGMPRFEAIGATYAEFLWIVPCIVLAYVMTLLFHGSNRLFKGLSSSMALGSTVVGTVVPPVIAGVIMGAVAMVLPYVLFPGEAQSELLMESWTTWTALALVATGLLKAVITPMCINMGWVGGDLFPSIFAGVAAGFGMAAVTGADPMLMVTVTTTAHLAGVLRKPLLAIAILFLCFPVDSIVWMGIAAVIGATLPIPRVLIGSGR